MASRKLFPFTSMAVACLDDHFKHVIQIWLQLWKIDSYLDSDTEIFGTAVDGRNPANQSRLVFIALSTGLYTGQVVVWDFHQEYLSIKTISTWRVYHLAKNLEPKMIRIGNSGKMGQWFKHLNVGLQERWKDDQAINKLSTLRIELASLHLAAKCCVRTWDILLIFDCISSNLGFTNLKLPRATYRSLLISRWIRTSNQL